MRFKKTRDEEIGVGIAPLIDIVFLLLIFFMVTSHFDVATGVRIKLPQVSTMVPGQQDQRVNLLIDRKGRLYLEGQGVEMENLGSRLKQIIKEKETFQLLLKADKEVQHGTVVRTMDVAKAAGVTSVVIAAEWRSDEIL